MTISVGIDMGSSTIKCVVLSNNQVQRWEVASATSQPLNTAQKLLESLESTIPVVATGYGRDLLETHFSCATISEIKAHSLGARFLFPECCSVIDIGGQDVKAIILDASGKIKRFEMNDRCAAGTGKFLEIMAQRLDYTLEEFSFAALRGADGVSISSMCTVFAESEIVGLLNRGCLPEDISRALHQSIVKRITSMFNRIEGNGPVALTGGGAKNAALLHFFENTLHASIPFSEYSQLAGAIGCAIHARR
jgi:predicted CoA-substrate-specific enzyme activase